jgi:iron(III) transport system permease protein
MFNKVKEFFQRDITPYLILSIPLIFLLIFLIWPVGTTILRAFAERGQDFSITNITFSNFENFVDSNLYRRSFYNSFLISFSVVFLTLLIGVPMGYFVARVEMPFKTLIRTLGVLPLIMPSFVGAFSWIILLGRNGALRIIVNRFLAIFGLALPPIYGMFGIIFSMTMLYYPFVFLLTYGAFSSTNPLLEESAMLMGAKQSKIFKTITFPLVLPSIGAAVILVFIRAIGNFGIPSVVGGQEYVLPTLIYFRVNGFWDLNGAAAIAIISVIITSAALLLQKYVISVREYETITADRSEQKLHKHPVIKVIAMGYCSIVLFVSLLPQITLFIMSFFEQWNGILPTGFTFSNYNAILTSLDSIKNSLIIVLSASVLAAIIGSLVAYITERKNPKGSAIIDLLVMAPFILPGIVVAVALLNAFSYPSPLIISGTFYIMIISFVIRRTPYVYRSVAASLTQLDVKLEESSMICGASWACTFRKVSFPLILPGIISGTILTLATLLKELSTSILLYSANTKTLPIQIYYEVSDGNFGTASALSVLLFVVVFIIIYLMNYFLGNKVSSSFKLG